jgi:hypothetical protein
MVKTLTRCQTGNSGIELIKSVFGRPKGKNFQTCLYGMSSYEYSFQCNLNHFISILYENLMPKILTAYLKSAQLKLCFLVCSLDHFVGT